MVRSGVLACLLLAFTDGLSAQEMAPSTRFEDQTGRYFSIAKAIETAISRDKSPLHVLIVSKSANPSSVAAKELDRLAQSVHEMVLVLSAETQLLGIAVGSSFANARITDEYLQSRVAARYFRGEWSPEVLQEGLVSAIKAIGYRVRYPPAVGGSPVVAGMTAMTGAPPPTMITQSGNNVSGRESRPPFLSAQLGIGLIVLLGIALAWSLTRPKRSSG